MTYELLPLELVTPNPGQPRKFFDPIAIEELAQSIKANGLLQPILVRRRGAGYQIVSGERRYQACKAAGLTHIPAVLKDLNDQDTVVAALIENIQREDLNPLEEARTLREILLDHGLTHDQLAERLGRSRSALTNRLRILQLPNHVQELIAEGKVSAGHAKMLAGIKDPAELEALVKRILTEGWSVYETEKQIAAVRETHLTGRGKKEGRALSGDIHVRQVEETLQEALGAKVRIRQGRAKSRIEIEFYNREDLERVVESLLGGCS